MLRLIALFLCASTLPAAAESFALVSAQQGPDPVPTDIVPASIQQAIADCGGPALGAGDLALVSASATFDEVGRATIALQPGGLLTAEQTTCLTAALGPLALPDRAWRRLQILLAASGPELPDGTTPPPPAVDPRGAIAASIAGRLDALQGCYQSALDADGTLDGDVGLTFIANGGAVTSVAVEWETLGSDEVLACLTAALAGVAVPALTSPTWVSHPFLFNPEHLQLIEVAPSSLRAGTAPAVLTLIDGRPGLNRCTSSYDRRTSNVPQLLPLTVEFESDGSVARVGRAPRLGAPIPRAIADCLGNQLAAGDVRGSATATFWLGPATAAVPASTVLALAATRPELLDKCRLTPSPDPTLVVRGVVRNGTVSEAAVIGSTMSPADGRCALRALAGQRWPDTEGVVTWGLARP